MHSPLCLVYPFMGLIFWMYIHATFQYDQMKAVQNLEKLTGKKKWGKCGEWKKRCGPCGPAAWNNGRWNQYRCGPRMNTQANVQPVP